VGQANAHAKLDLNAVRRIERFKAHGLGAREIGRKIGVTHSTILRVLNGESYPDIPRTPDDRWP